MTYDELLIKQKSFLDKARIYLNQGDYSNFNKIMDDFNKISDDYLNLKKLNGKQKKFIYELKILYKKSSSPTKVEYYSTLENALERKQEILSGNTSININKVFDVYVNDEPILKSFYSF